MKKLFVSFSTVAAAAALLVSCNKNELAEVPETPVKTVTLSVCAGEPASKVTIGEKQESSYPMSWDDEGEKIKVFEVVDSSNYSVVQSSSYTLNEGKAHFMFDLDEKEGITFDYYFFSPSSAFGDKYYPSYRDVSATLPSAQTPFPSSADTAAILLVGSSTGRTSQGGSIGVSFKSIAAYGKLKVKNLSSMLSDGETVKSIGITAVDKKLAGSFYYYVNDSISGLKDWSNTITLDAGNLTISDEFDVWFSCVPVDFMAGDSLVFSVETNLDYYYKASALKNARSLVAGKVSELGTLDATGLAGSPDYTGDYVALIQNSGENYWAMSCEGKSSKLLPKTLAYDGGGSYVATDSTIFWHLEKIAGTVYSMKSCGKYISMPENTKAVMVDTAYRLKILNTGSEFNIASEENGVLLQKNSSSDYFAFYSSSQKSNFQLVPATLVIKPVISPIEDQEADAVADTIEVAYTLSNPTAASDTVSAKTSDSWLEVLGVSSNVITIAVTENTGAERTGTVTVFYEGADTVTFVVKQATGGQKTYEMTIDSSSKSGKNNVHWTSTSDSLLTWDGVTWSTSVEGTYSFIAKTDFCQIGSQNNPATNVSISTDAFAGKKIKSASLTGYCMSKTGPALTITAGTTVILPETSLVKSTSTEFFSTNKEAVTIPQKDSCSLTFSINSSANAGIAISKIKVVYTD